MRRKMLACAAAVASGLAVAAPAGADPLAEFTMLVAGHPSTTGVAPVPVIFNAALSQPDPLDPYCTVNNWVWAFGDLSSTSGSVVRHTYLHPGTFTVALTISDTCGGSSTTTHDLTITEAVNAPFSDTEASFADLAIDTLFAKAIVSGTAPLIYSPQGTLSRAQMTVFLVQTYQSVYGPVSGAQCGLGFSDIQASALQVFITTACGLSLTAGTSPTTFSPDAPVTREQMAVFLIRLYELIAGTSPPQAATGFTDIGNSFAHDAIEQVYALNITAGVTPTRYGPGAFVTREQMAQFIYRLLQTV